MAKVKIIENQKELMKALDISSIDRIKEESIQKKLFDLARQGRITETFIKELIIAFPELVRGFCSVVEVLSKVGYQVEKTKQARWEALTEIAKRGSLTDEQILEVIRIIRELEMNDPKIDWPKVLELAKTATTYIGLAAVIIAGGLLWIFSQSLDQSKSSD